MPNIQGVHQSQILTHSVLVGLTPLIPIPFVDEMVRELLLRRMVRILAAAHRVDLSPAEVRTLADEPKESWFKGAAMSVVLMPIKLIVRKAFFVLQGKRVIDLASTAYHRGYLLDVAFADRWCVPEGPRRPHEIRQAIDAVCREANTEPVAWAFRAGLEQSWQGMIGVVGFLRTRLGKGGGPAAREAAEARVSQVVEDATSEASGIGTVVGRVHKTISEVPSQHFEDLRSRLHAKLGGNDRA
jgi:hypothetical protein